MIKKFVMITIYLIVGWQAKAAPAPAEIIQLRTPANEREVSASKLKNICMMNAGDVGKLKYKGKTYEQAFSKVTNECFQKRSDLYVKKHNEFPTQDRQIEFAEVCLNSIKCI